MTINGNIYLKILLLLVIIKVHGNTCANKLYYL